MAKKGQAIQLQTEVNSDEEWEKLLERDGLIVVDIYSDWCGPCSGMVANLKKLKLDVGGDMLQLAIAKSDNITCLERFRNKSEPTWMFISGGKMVNLMFGANAPKLTRLILEELRKETESITGTPRTETREINEYAQEEQARYDVIWAAEAKSRRIEEEARAKALHERRLAQANAILETYAAMGTILILPQAKDHYVEVMGDLWNAAQLNISSKEKVRLTEEMLEEMLYFADWSFPDETMQDILENQSLALLIKSGSDEISENMDNAVLAFVYGKSKAPPGSTDSPAQLLISVDEEEGTELMGVWAPPNSLTKAYAIKVLFPNMATSLLLPEPEVTPPHLAIAYDAFKRREVMEVMEQYEQDVMRYGFFTSEDAKNAKLIAKTSPNFEKKLAESTTHSEKLIIQLSKKRSEAFLAFAQLNPSYMSPNVKVGEEECKLLFPEGYDEPEIVEEEVKKKPSKKRPRKSSQQQPEKTAEQPTEGEGATELGLPAVEEEEGEKLPAGESEEAQDDGQNIEEGLELDGAEGLSQVEGIDQVSIAPSEVEGSNQVSAGPIETEGADKAASESLDAEGADKATSPMTDEAPDEEIKSVAEQPPS